MINNLQVFRNEQFGEVLPSIRKHGFYETPRAEVQNERLASVQISSILMRWRNE